MTEYNFNNIKRISSGENFDKYHIYVVKTKWLELFNNEDIRFFLHSKFLLNDLIENYTGHVIKISSWDLYDLRTEYELSKKCKHPNLVRYNCYFEYEEDIINYLCDHQDFCDLHQDSAIIIHPYYTPLWYDIDLNILKQIIFTLYTLLYKFKIELKSINMMNIFMEERQNSLNIKYIINEYKLQLNSKNVIKIDEYSNAVVVKHIDENNEKQLVSNISNILLQINSEISSRLYKIVNKNRNNLLKLLKLIESIP